MFAKITEFIKMPFGALTHVGPRNHVLDGGQDLSNPFAAETGDKLAMQPFAKQLRTLAVIIHN